MQIQRDQNQSISSTEQTKSETGKAKIRQSPGKKNKKHSTIQNTGKQ